MPSHAFRLSPALRLWSFTPVTSLPPVWPRPLSLAATNRFSLDFFSSPYLDVSLREVPLICLSFSTYDPQLFAVRVSTFGYPRIITYLQLPVAFRS